MTYKFENGLDRHMWGKKEKNSNKFDHKWKGSNDDRYLRNKTKIIKRSLSHEAGKSRRIGCSLKILPSPETESRGWRKPEKNNHK